MSDTDFTNQLINETSPYLLQHAHNPVDWHAWNHEALDKARQQNKPILLSIGYSACHWCHVMEHESFEDEQVAEYLNEHFVSIKVDREERPDLDKVYQTAHQLLTQRPGGWPLNVVISPHDHAPFFAGTYFPKEPRYGMPCFIDVMRRVSAHYQDNQHRLAEHANAVIDAFDQMESTTRGEQTASDDILEQALQELMRQYDPVNGGFGGAPKFPHPTHIEVCLRYQAHPGNTPAARVLHVARHTLETMANGGIYDQLGGGFCRYAVEERWAIPHFEKSLFTFASTLCTNPIYRVIMIRQFKPCLLCDQCLSLLNQLIHKLNH